MCEDVWEECISERIKHCCDSSLSFARTQGTFRYHDFRSPFLPHKKEKYLVNNNNNEIKSHNYDIKSQTSVLTFYVLANHALVNHIFLYEAELGFHRHSQFVW